MEDSKQQNQIINLGNLLVNELGLENGVDTLSRWMAHYVAEKISLVERLPEGKEKENTQKECFETILKLWENRWELPQGKRPLERFKPILNVLNRINPDKEESFFYRRSEIGKISNSDEISKYITMIEQIDKVARIWIDFLLQQATQLAKDETTKDILDNAVATSNNYDIDTIQILYDDIEGFTKKYKAETFQKRIDELEKFAKLNEFILKEYRKESDVEE
jgi:hypothetical protein